MATVIPRSYIEEYSNALNGISDTAKASLVVALEKVDYSQPVADVRNAVIAIMQAACGASTDVTARLAADFYDGLRLRMVGEPMGAVADSMRKPEATENTIRAFIQVIVDGGDTDEFIAMCADRLNYENNKAANECMVANAQADPLRPLWARVPFGEETCDFCIMLASRGFVYGNAELASHSHANCDCRVIPGWGRDSKIEGYDADRYFDKYLNKQIDITAKRAQRMVDDVFVSRQAASKSGRGSKFSGIAEMNEYLKDSSNIDELYKRSEIVLQDFKKYWSSGDNASESMFKSISNTAKAVRKALI